MNNVNLFFSFLFEVYRLKLIKMNHRCKMNILKIQILNRNSILNKRISI